MVDRKKETEAKVGGAYRSGDSGAGHRVDELEEMTPRLAQLADSISRDRTEISEEQRAFIEDFAEEVGKGTGEDC